MSKYDWTGVPKHIKWIATDGYSNWAWGYVEQEPFIDEDLWRNNIDEIPIDVEELYGVAPFKGDWRESLEKRP